jgi:ribosomal protein S18 acetylase RimI-like enzyme
MAAMSGDEETVRIAVEALESFAGTDLEDLCEATEAAIVDGGGFGWITPPRRDILEKYWQGVMLVPGRSLFVGRIDGVIAGSAQLIRQPRNNEAQAFSAQLMSVFVAPWARGRGLGRRLVAAAEEAARQNGVEILNLDIRATQTAAIRLYEHAGYARWGTHPEYAMVEDHVCPGHYYYKRLETDREGPPASDLRRGAYRR